MRLRFNLIKFLFILFFIFLLIVAVYQIYCYFYVSASTEYTTVIECEDTVTVSGYFLRDESVIRAENSKYIDITVNSGEKISKNGIIANVYSTEDSAKIQSQIRELQLRIDEMNSVISAANGYNTGATYENEIKKYAINVSSNISEGNITAAFEAAADFSSNIIKSKISAGEIVDYSSKLSELKAQMEQLTRMTPEQVREALNDEHVRLLLHAALMGTDQQVSQAVLLLGVPAEERGAFLAEKPSGRRWPCVHATGTLYAGYPHFHFYANPAFAANFLAACRKEKHRHA